MKTLVEILLPMKTEAFNLIGTTTHFDTKSKLHVAKEVNDMNTMCGINLGFEYEIVSINGAANEADNRLFTKEYIYSKMPDFANSVLLHWSNTICLETPPLCNLMVYQNGGLTAVSFKSNDTLN